MSLINIQQVPDDDATIIEGTKYSNDLLRILGQHGIAKGPFVIVNRADGMVTLRTINKWPEEPTT